MAAKYPNSGPSRIDAAKRTWPTDAHSFQRWGAVIKCWSDEGEIAPIMRTPAKRVGGLTMRYAFTRSLIALAMAMLVPGTIILCGGAQAPTVMEGLAACQDRCDARSPEGNARGQCRHACELWWYCNGSDASYGMYVAICDRLKNEPSAIATTVQPRRPPVRATTPSATAAPK